MFLRTIRLRNFRNVSLCDLDFNPRFNLIIGKNAQGKTNLLESVYYLGFLNSFRAAIKKELIKEGESASLIESTLCVDEMEHAVKVILEERKRTVTLDGKKANLFKEYYGLIPILLFEPKDVYLFRDSPSQRRKFLNRALFLDNPGVLKGIRDYEKIVSQKNKLLKESSLHEISLQLPIWNEQLASLGSAIVFDRLSWIKRMSELLPREYQNLSQGQENFHLQYHSKIDYTLEDTKEDIYLKMTDALKHHQTHEIRRRESLYGPHRDDWIAHLDERQVGLRGSQGENRSAIIALKSAQVHLYQKEHHYPPLFLLDDVASELDLHRQEALFSYLRETQGQVFLTTTEPGQLEHYFKGEGRSFMVDHGQIRVLG